MIEKGYTSAERKVEKKTGLLVIKYNENDNLPYCGEHLSTNSG